MVDFVSGLVRLFVCIAFVVSAIVICSSFGPIGWFATTTIMYCVAYAATHGEE